MNKKKIVLLGINADPPHLGHQKLCFDVLKALGPDTHVIVMPAGLHPFGKQSKASFKDRLELTELLFADLSHVSVDNFEGSKQGLSYSYETLVYLKSKYPQAQLYFVISYDAAASFFSWHKAHQILCLATPIISKRPSYQLEDKIRHQFEALSHPIFLNNEPLEVSSSSIREALRLHRHSLYLTPLQNDYIIKNKLYI
jgi:nicotinate-nucleotide adenylyltransferase